MYKKKGPKMDCVRVSNSQCEGILAGLLATAGSIASAVCLLLAAPAALAYPAFNGQADLQVDAYGYYYEVSGGLFPTGKTPNGDNASGGTLRYLSDEPLWGLPIDAWQKDDWYATNSGIALTLKNGASTVYDNNGLDSGSFPTGFYTYDANNPAATAGAVVGYSMPNNYDFIYAGYFQLTAATTITQLEGYFVYSGNPNDALTGPFDPNNPVFRYDMNIWSNVANDLLPVNTGGFTGDVFSSLTTPGSFAWADTGFDRTGSSSVQNIYRLTYTLNAPLTLQAGTYWFSHDVTVVPEPGTFALLGLGLGLLALKNGARSRPDPGRYPDPHPPRSRSAPSPTNGERAGLRAVTAEAARHSRRASARPARRRCTACVRSPPLGA